MNAFVLLAALLAVVAVVLLWKLVLAAAGLGGAQWVLTSVVDGPAVDVVAFGVPALLLVVVVSRGLPGRAGGLVAGGHSRKAVA